MNRNARNELIYKIIMAMVNKGMLNSWTEENEEYEFLHEASDDLLVNYSEYYADIK